MRTAHPRALRALATLVALVLCLFAAGCGDDEDDEADTATPAAETASFPVTVTHAYGTTEIPSEPQRIVALGSIERDLVAALDGDLVGFGQPERTQGREAPPWLAPHVDPDAELIAIGGDGLPLERIAALQPDLILAQSVFTGLPEEQYDRLSRIAPTVAFASGPFVDSWQDISVAAGRALGREDEASALVADVEARLRATAEEHPAWTDASYMVSNVFAPDQVGAIVSDEDPTTDVLGSLGFTLSPAVDEIEGDEGGTTGMVSAERLDLLDADVLFLNFAVPDAQEGLESSPVFERLDVVKDEAVVTFDPVEWASLRDPSVLAIPFLLENLVPRLEAIDLEG